MSTAANSDRIGEAREARGLRPRARDIGIDIGILRPGRDRAITDVKGVRIGHCTLVEGEGSLIPGKGPVRTGVTSVVPHEGNLFREKVSAAAYAFNAFGKSIGFQQVNELGNLETPIVLTNTLNVPLVADAVVEWSVRENPEIGIRTGTVNPVVGEVNDGFLNDIQGRHVRKEHVFEAIDAARPGPIEEGSIGAGIGCCCLGWKGGIGTSSRVLSEKRGGYTVGVLVQTNFGGILTVNGAPVGRELGRHAVVGNDMRGRKRQGLGEDSLAADDAREVSSKLDWSSAVSLLRTLTASGAVMGAALAAAALVSFLTLGRQRLARTEVAGGVIGFALGAALFAPSIAEVQVPLQSLATRWAMGHLATANSLVLSIPAILLTGIVQEPAKLLAAGLGMWAVRSGRRRAAPTIGALAGVGYGGMEAAIILSYALAVVPSGVFPWVATVERTSAIIFHLSLPGIVTFWWARGAARGLLFLLGAVLAHAALDSLPVLLGMGLVGVAAVEVIVGMLSLALLAYLVFLVRGARRVEQND